MTAVVVRGDAARLPLPDASVDLVVASPPYWGLREYTDGGMPLAGQLGAEPTWQEYLAALLDCTREWARVLKPAGSIFVNLGDRYSGAGRGGNRGPGPAAQPVAGPRATSLLMLPERYRIATVDELGLILREVLIWDKPNGMPESQTTRCRRSHEDWVHLVRNPGYFVALDEIRQPHVRSWQPGRNGGRAGFDRGDHLNVGLADASPHPLGALPGTVWRIATRPFRPPTSLPKHIAPFPSEWPRRLILGWAPSGICTLCGQGRRPTATTTGMDTNRPQARRALELADRAGLTETHLAALRAVGLSDTGRAAATQSGTGKNTPEVHALAGEARAALGGYAREFLLHRPTGFAYVCGCPTPDAPTRPAVVLDPCGGTGTTALVASVLGRVGISVDLSADYNRIAAWRTADPRERARAARRPVPEPEPETQLELWPAS